MPVFDRAENGITRMAQRLGRVGIVEATFAAARETNRGATLLLNDFDMSADYEHLIEGCLEAGIQIDALGLQSHMHQGYWGVEKTEDVLDRFSRFGLPLHFTETTLVTRAPDAGRDRRPQRLPGDRLAERRPTARQARPKRPRRTTRRCCHTRRSRRSRGGASRTAAGSTRRPAWSAPTARRSPPTSGSTASSRATGGCRRRRCGPTTPGGSGSTGSSATTTSRGAAGARHSASRSQVRSWSPRNSGRRPLDRAPTLGRPSLGRVR